MCLVIVRACVCVCVRVSSSANHYSSGKEDGSYKLGYLVKNGYEKWHVKYKQNWGNALTACVITLRF